MNTPQDEIQVWAAREARRVASVCSIDQLHATLSFAVRDERRVEATVAAIRDRDPRGELHTSASFVLFFNADPEWIQFTMPPAEYGTTWRMVIDTSESDPDEPKTAEAGGSFWVPDRSLVVLQRDE